MNGPPLPPAQQPINSIQPNNLETLVRHYVYYDNLISDTNGKLTIARKRRDDIEGRIIHYLRANNMENAILHVSGARIQNTIEKIQPSMSITRLESYLHKYYSQKGNGVDETEAILRFIRLQKANDTQSVARLKKTLITNTPQPANGGSNQNH
jgi:hypothetical protein